MSHMTYEQRRLHSEARRMGYAASQVQQDFSPHPDRAPTPPPPRSGQPDGGGEYDRCDRGSFGYDGYATGSYGSGDLGGGYGKSGGLGGPASKYSTTDAYDQSGGLGASSKYSSSLPHAGAYASDYSPPLTSSSYGTPSTYSSSLGSDSLGLASGSYGSSLGGSYEAAGGYGASGGYGARDPFSPNITDQGLSYAPAYNPSSGGYGSSGAYGSQGGYESSSGGYGPSAGGYGSSSKTGYGYKGFS